MAIQNVKNTPKSTTKSTQKTEVSYEQIAKLAHELYLQRGGCDGRDVEDWLQAERILKARQKQN
ncbi:MAG: DUF2934 domain-containing protein [Candidatus Omnitrophica bacterium]|nr:DUF2934 domain-containing protein [Candidatus Omnitrophota bacterium]